MGKCRDSAVTDRLYDGDAYLSEFSAAVVSVTGDEAAGRWDIVLDATAFFPEQGGQTADTGTLNDRVRVLDVRISDGVIHHLCDAPLPAGAVVTGKLDFSHRFSHMQQHTGEHILSGLCARTYGCRNVGFHLSDHIVTVDYDKPLSLAQLDELEWAANRAVWADLPVRCWFPTAEEAECLDYRSKKEISDRLRVVSIPGVDDCACCAPHVHTTGEVGLISIMGVTAYKGGVRLSILCGGRALAAVKQKQRCLEALTRRMTCGEDELLQVLGKRDAELRDLRQRTAALEAELLVRDAEAARQRGARLRRTAAADMQAMIGAANCLAEGTPEPVGVFSGSDEAGYSFCLRGSNGLRDFFEAFRAALGARGGGDSQLIRGRCPADWAAISTFFSE